MAFKRVKNISRETAAARPVDAARPADRAGRGGAAWRTTRSARSAIRAGRGRAATTTQAFRIASGLRPAVDRFFTDVFVMVEDPDCAPSGLSLLRRLHELLLELADISEIVPKA